MNNFVWDATWFVFGGSIGVLVSIMEERDWQELPLAFSALVVSAVGIWSQL